MIARLAARQRGLVTRSSLLARGLAPRQIERRLASGHLHPIHRGVYAVGHPHLTPHARAQGALLAVGRPAALSHRTAAALWGLLPPVDGPVHVTHPPPHRRGREGIVLHRAPLTRAEVRAPHGLVATSPARTLTDLAATHPDELPRALNEALVRRLVRAGELRPAGRGATVLRALLDAGPAPTRSEAEHLLLTLILKARLPRPQTNVRVHGHEVDALWPGHRLVVEIDGFAAHGTKRAFEHDRERDGDLAAAGYRVVRFTWRQLTAEPERVVATLAATLART